jgi:two-component system LytT family response regulator
MPSDPVLHVLIADDEQHVHDHLSSLLSGHPEVGPVSTASSPQSALDVLQSDTPDLAVLSVQFSTPAGLSVAEAVGPDAMPPTVFVSTDDAFAVKAFNLGAVDYLLKPVTRDRFAKAFGRALQAIKLERIETLGLQFRDLLGGLDRPPVAPGNGHAQNGHEPPPHSTPGPDEYLRRVVVEGQSQLQIVPVTDIRYLTAEDTYVRLHTEDTSYLVRRRLYEMEQRLNPAQFIRIHRSTIVRLDCIERLLPRSGADYTVQLDNAKTFRVSRSRQDDLLHRLETGTPTPSE